MKVISRIMIWITVGAVALLVVLSIAGAFLNVKGARPLFNSLPLAVFWIFLVVLLVLGFVLFKRLRNSFGLLCVHVGPILILIGSILGSDSGHDLSRKFFGTKKISAGQMQIFENDLSNTVFDDEGEPVGKLPFIIGLNDFRIEYYPEDKSWLLWVVAPPAGSNHTPRQKVINWKKGTQTQIPFTGLTLEVLEDIPNASPGLLEITQADGKKTIIPADVGQEMSLDDSKGNLRIVQVFSHLTVQPGGKVVNLPGSNAMPALKIEFDSPKKDKSPLYIFAGQFQPHGHEIEGVKFQYLPKADPTSELPAMEVLISDGDKQLRAWLTVRDSLPLTPLLDTTKQTAEHKGHAHDPSTYLVLARLAPQIKDYKSDLTVLDEGSVVAEKVIEVNDPLHYGGYHFYQRSYGTQHGRYTILSVKSDTGLWYVYAGFTLLCAGVFWLGWVRPGLAYLMKRSKNGN